ncbi:substrate-binding domain-containing protein [Mucilaginibacter sp. Bleaf8]|uniref:PstS family phosphate ABC transporter substrate-binding protein n=1 Tax=Mucilaginibacter sp. Bleaf8 TaxID=2834430 RepID=UPI001BD1022D|nr:substrate-binding domain-containing protein [Mucilaginibacter sp. Bleaf8]MBS7564500.1 substrate-binding domain-containing protein [Mucilaginibacter sp. Bleaf8]
MKNSVKIIIGCFIVLAVFITCRQRGKNFKNNEDTATSGTIQILADESFKPILDEEAYIFKALYPQTNIQFIYKPEIEALKLYMNDSIRTAILAKELTQDELQVFKDRKLPPEINKFAVDAVVLIVNKQSADTAISVSQIKAMLNGKTMVDRDIVFDNPSSSLVRYLKQFSGNTELKQKNIYALKSNKDVITYVSEHRNAIGIVGFSWLDDPDKDYADAVAKVQLVGVKDEADKKYGNQFFKPSQETLALKQYPLRRDLYVYNSTGRTGLASAFQVFLGSERGQRIILKSGLLPDSIPAREINIK